jgi:hypothetical protein
MKHHIQNKKIHGDREHIDDCQSQEKERMRSNYLLGIEFLTGVVKKF